MRGGDPNAIKSVSDVKKYSPHARGRSSVEPVLEGYMEVFPACAGVIP